MKAFFLDLEGKAVRPVARLKAYKLVYTTAMRPRQPLIIPTTIETTLACDLDLDSLQAWLLGLLCVDVPVPSDVPSTSSKSTSYASEELVESQQSSSSSSVNVAASVMDAF